MPVSLSEDQEFFRQTTERFLTEHASSAEARRMRDDADGFSLDYWRRGAELGWVSLLVDEAHGGGTISGHGLVDLGLVAKEFGRRAAPGPLLPTNVVAAALSEQGGHDDVLAALVAGETICAWCMPQVADNTGFRPTVQITTQADGFVVRGTAQPVEAARQASHLLVSGDDGQATTQLLVPTSAAGVTIEPMGTVDLSRRYGAVTFDAVHVPLSAAVGPPREAADAVEHQLLVALTLLNAEAVGALQAGFDLTVAWAFDRYSFGRPLASYQALKHRFADMLTWLQASHAIADAACGATDAGTADAEELTSAAKAYIGQFGADLLHDCVQLHGGIGVTFEHDLHLFLRRFTVNRSSAGSPSVHRRRIAAIVEAHHGAAA